MVGRGGSSNGPALLKMKSNLRKLRNYPFHNMLNHVLSGIFSGNAVVTKCSEHTSWSSMYFHNICQAALEANGFDPELVQLCTGLAETGKALVECEHVDKIFFTGSPNVGRHVMRGAAPFLKPVVLELGGEFSSLTQT